MLARLTIGSVLPMVSQKWVLQRPYVCVYVCEYMSVCMCVNVCYGVYVYKCVFVCNV